MQPAILMLQGFDPSPYVQDFAILHWMISTGLALLSGVPGARVPVTSPACGPDPKKYLQQDPCCLAEGKIDHCLVRLKAPKPLDLTIFFVIFPVG